MKIWGGGGLQSPKPPPPCLHPWTYTYGATRTCLHPHPSVEKKKNTLLSNKIILHSSFALVCIFPSLAKDTPHLRNHLSTGTCQCYQHVYYYCIQLILSSDLVQGMLRSAFRARICWIGTSTLNPPLCSSDRICSRSVEVHALISA